MSADLFRMEKTRRERKRERGSNLEPARPPRRQNGEIECVWVCVCVGSTGASTSVKIQGQ